MKKTYKCPQSDIIDLNAYGNLLDEFMGNSRGATLEGDGGGADNSEIQGAKQDFTSQEEELPTYNVWND